MLTDTHCHLDFHTFNSDRQAVIQRAVEAGVTRILIPSLDWESSRSAVKLAKPHPNLFSAIGFHPTEVSKWGKEAKTELRRLVAAQRSTLSSTTSAHAQSAGDSSLPPVAQNNKPGKIVAIGEIGLDYYWEAAAHDVQREVLEEQLSLAEELSLPVIIHSREKGDAENGECASDLLKILEKWTAGLRRRPELVEGSEKEAPASRPGVLHSFSGSLETAQHAIRLGFYIGVTGPVTYKKAERRRQIIASLPLERLLIETDAPFLTPQPQRGKRNEPAFVGHIADKIAEIHMTTREQVAEITSANASHLFGWGG